MLSIYIRLVQQTQCVAKKGLTDKSKMRFQKPGFKNLKNPKHFKSNNRGITPMV